jgi:hypothetical protein
VKEQRILGFSDGLFQYLAAKPVMAGAGCNFQRHCRKAVFVGIGFKFHDFIQAIHRIHRFGQTGVVEIDVIYAESEREVRAELERKWAQHNEMVAKMGEIIREYGLSSAAMADQLKRAMGVERVEARGERYADRQQRLRRRGAAHGVDSVDLIVTSIPFSTQYEYSPNYADFGHTDDNDHFWQQMDFLIPELLRVLKPGRDACIHVKDRIVPGGLTGLGFQTLQPFGDECRYHFRGRLRLPGHHHQHHRRGAGEQPDLPAGLLRAAEGRHPHGRRRARADHPAAQAALRPLGRLRRQAGGEARPDYVDADGGEPRPTTARPGEDGRDPAGAGHRLQPRRWQLDAGGLLAISGDRLLSADEWLTFENMSEAYQLWKKF